MKKPMKVFVFMAYGLDTSLPEWWTLPQSWSPQAWHCKVLDNAERVFIKEQTFMVEIPDDFNPVPNQVAALEKEKSEAMDLYQRTVAQIDDKLSQLLALTNEVQT